MYHKKDVDFTYLPWEDFLYQVEHKDAKKCNEMYYPWFTKVIINFFMTKDQSIPKRNKVNWHFARDDHMFTMIKLVQQYSAILPVELTNEAIRNSKSYKELKTSAKVDKPAKEKQHAKSSKAKGLTVLSEVALTEAEQMKLAIKKNLTQNHISHASGSGKSSKDDDDDEHKISEHDDDVDDQSDDDDDDDDEQTNSDNDGDDLVHRKFSTHDEEDKDEESFDPIVQTHSQVENTDDEDNDEDIYGMNVEGDEIDDEGENEEDEANELYRDMNINLKGQQQSLSVSSRFVSNMLNPSPDTGIDSIFESTLRVDVPVATTAEPPLLSATTLPPPSIPIILHVQETPAPSTPNVPSSSLQDLPNFSSLFGFDHRLKTLKTNFSEFMQTNQFAKAISLIPDGLYDKAQAENEDLLNKLNENMQNIIKEKVKEQVKVQVSKILPKIEKTVNEQLEAKVLTRSSNSSKTSHAVAADLSELELKKILIDKMESNKDTVTLKRRRDDKDKDKETSVGSNQGSKRRRAGKEPESITAPKEKTSKTSDKSTKGSKSHHKTASESTPAEELMHIT
nr:hypothetical protein [Tanacetum cinerariifolium]